VPINWSLSRTRSRNINAYSIPYTIVNTLTAVTEQLTTNNTTCWSGVWRIYCQQTPREQSLSSVNIFLRREFRAWLRSCWCKRTKISIAMDILRLTSFIQNELNGWRRNVVQGKLVIDGFSLCHALDHAISLAAPDPKERVPRDYHAIRFFLWHLVFNEALLK